MFKPGASNTEEQQATNSSKKQVVPYRTLYQMRSYVENKLGLRQVYVQDLPNQDNLDGCYFGGRIVNVVPSSSRSQGGGSIVFVKDNDDLGMDTLHGVLQVSQELMDQLPTLDNQFMLFVSGASLEEVNDDEEQQFTQETGKSVTLLWENCHHGNIGVGLMAIIVVCLLFQLTVKWECDQLILSPIPILSKVE